MEIWMGGPAQIMMAERRRRDDLVRYEFLRKHNLLDLPAGLGLRQLAAAWLVQMAMRLDARLAESAVQGGPSEPAIRLGTAKHA